MKCYFRRAGVLVMSAALFLQMAIAHDLHALPGEKPVYDRSIKPPSIPLSTDAITLIEDTDFFAIRLRSAGGDGDIQKIAVAIAETFRPFAPRVKVRWDDKYFYVESDGMPAHTMMVGITAWQQQVPIRQAYTGDNAWRFPLVPVVAKSPLSAKDHFFRGAIAIAANGVPIFNPIKNDGRTDTFLAGELDEFGGHSGRADDYHYHVAPLHLQDAVGKGKPIAYALDGYPIYGLTDPDGSKPAKLDQFNGHTDTNGNYHYHSTKSYPYINGGFHGEVTEREGQVDPQPRARGVRPSTEPLKGAKITGYTVNPDGTATLVYTLAGTTHKVVYGALKDGSFRFQFFDGNGEPRVETYDGRSRDDKGPRDDRRPRDDREPRGQGEGGGNRIPWIVQHAAEMDADADGSLTSKEVEAEITKAFGAYDRDKDSRISQAEIDAGQVRSALGGFVRQHRTEIDADSDGSLTVAELRAVVMRMFERADKDRDGKLSKDETAGATPLERPRGKQ